MYVIRVIPVYYVHKPVNKYMYLTALNRIANLVTGNSCITYNLRCYCLFGFRNIIYHVYI